MLTTLVENYPGFPEGIQGPDLMMAMRKQAERFGAEILDVDFQSGDFSSGGPFKLTAEDKAFEARAVIIATGADTKWLDVPGEKEKIGRGVSSCATCDAPFFRGKNVIVVGGGDTAMEDSIFLTNFANSVTVVHRRGELRASKIMQDRAKANPKIQFVWNSSVTEVLGQDKVSGVRIKNFQTGQEQEMAIDGVFVAIGHLPNTGAFSGIEKDENGYILVFDHTRTNVEGVFVAGDVHDAHYQQAVTAAGFGCMAAIEVERWLSGQKR